MITDLEISEAGIPTDGELAAWLRALPAGTVVFAYNDYDNNEEFAMYGGSVIHINRNAFSHIDLWCREQRWPRAGQDADEYTFVACLPPTLNDAMIFKLTFSGVFER